MLRLLARHARTTLHAHSVSGRTGLVVRYEHQVAAVIGLDIADHHVVQLWVVLNPDKLRSWNQHGTPPGMPDATHTTGGREENDTSSYSGHPSRIAAFFDSLLRCATTPAVWKRPYGRPTGTWLPRREA
ncbi:hypothetical protein AB0D65_10525 [Streptomyces griseoloalbus]|uniref:Uncharacterized protein n=1 Tax=Streptomyces griseoloalbus TaxID=67303 RepID=A0ABV3E2R0_9ACTN